MAGRVEILLGKDGSINVEAFDFQGNSCEEATAFLDELFGSADEVERKMEYFLGEKETDFLGNGLCG